MLENFYNGYLEFKNHKLVYPIIINLGGDAASLKSAFKSSKEAVFVFEVLPLDCKLRLCVIHIMPTQNGSSPKQVVDRFFEIARYLIEIGFIVKYYFTDGDISFDTFHSDFFKSLSDLLQLLKCARARLVNHPLMIDIENLICINTLLLFENTDLGVI